LRALGHTLLGCLLAMTVFAAGWFAHDHFSKAIETALTVQTEAVRRYASEVDSIRGTAESIRGAVADLRVHVLDTPAKTSELVSQRIEPLAPIKSQLDELLRSARVPMLPGLHIVTWQDRKIKTQDFAFNPETDLQFLKQTGLPKSWEPVAGDDPEATLPYKWPELFAKTRSQPFSPETVFYNLVGMANWIKQNGRAVEIRPYADFLLARTREYLTPSRNGGQMVTYHFELDWFDKRLAPSWVSAHGNGSLIAAALYYFKTTGDQRFMKLADELVMGLRTLDGTDPHWLASIDQAQFLWFEEYPIDGPKKSHVINGHIWTTFALVDYCRTTKDADTCTMAQAGITTVKRYLATFRSPGKVSRYSLYTDDNFDYGPTRAINQQRSLYELTGDKFFADAANVYMSDMPY